MVFTSFQAINTYASPVHCVHTEFVYMSMFLGFCVFTLVA